MSSARKPRSDAKLLSLPQEQQEQIATWLTLENRSYAEVLSLVSETFGIQTSTGALQNFYASFAAPWKYTRARGEAEAFAALMEGQFDEATTKRVKQLAFEAMASSNPDLKSAKALLKMAGDTAKLSLQRQKLDLDARKVAILEQKAALADKGNEIAQDKDLTNEEKGKRLRALFGMS